MAPRGAREPLNSTSSRSVRWVGRPVGVSPHQGTNMNVDPSLSCGAAKVGWMRSPGGLPRVAPPGGERLEGRAAGQGAPGSRVGSGSSPVGCPGNPHCAPGEEGQLSPSAQQGPSSDLPCSWAVLVGGGRWVRRWGGQRDAVVTGSLAHWGVKGDSVALAERAPLLLGCPGGGAPGAGACPPCFPTGGC